MSLNLKNRPYQIVRHEASLNGQTVYRDVKYYDVAEAELNEMCRIRPVPILLCAAVGFFLAQLLF